MVTVAAPPLSTTGSSQILLRDVSWEVYRQLRDQEANNSVRMIYLDGDLLLMSPALRHDQGSRLLFLIVAAVAEASQIEFEPTGTTTLRSTREGAGKEPDEGFYLGEAAIQVRANTVLNLPADPPPSLVIEVAPSGDSTMALATYARLGVPEVWVYRPLGPSLWFGRLAGPSYEPIARSTQLPPLTITRVLEAFATRASGGMGTLAWATWLRSWTRDLPEPGILA